MKKLILSAAALLAVVSAPAQATLAASAQGTETSASTEKSEWLPSFAAIEVAAPLDIVFVRVPDTEAPKIVYDTKGSYTTKFKAEVKDKVLRISERADSRRPERTAVKVCYNDVRSISVSDAAATFEGTLAAQMLDLTVGGRASVTAALDVKDLKMELSGRSSACLSGTVRYLSLSVSTGEVEASALEVMSAQVNATSGGVVTLTVTDRLEATTSTKGSVSYKGTPGIVRGGSKFMGGTIGRIE